MRWRIYYDTGSTFSDTDGSPYDAPALGVLVIACEDESVGRVLVYGQSYYFWWDEHARWWGGNLFGMFDYLQRPGPRRVLFGREVPNPAWNGAIKLATDDLYLPPKTAIHPFEKSMARIRD